MTKSLMKNYPGFAFFVNRLLVVKQHLKNVITVSSILDDF